MALNNISILVFLVFISLQSINAHEEDLLTKACSETTETQRCLNLLKSDKEVNAAASTKNDLNLALAIIKYIIAQTRTTHDMILKKKATNPAYGNCESLWAEMIPSFERILQVTTKNKGYKDDTGDYDFTVVADNIGNCVTDLMNKKILDPEIIKAGDLIGLSISAADKVLSSLKGN